MTRIVQAGPRLTAKARAERSARRLRLAKWVGLVGAGLVPLLLLGWLLLASPLLAVRSVAVSGTRLLTAAQVRDAAAVQPGTPLARVDTGAVARRVEAAGPFRKATVRRSWPATLVVHVWPRTAVAAVPLVGSYGLLSDDGVVFAQALAPGEVPLLQVADPAPSDETTMDALSVLRALSPALRGALVRLIADAPARIRLELSGGRTVVWGDSTENAAKVRVATMLLASPGSARTFDVSAPSVVSIR